VVKYISSILASPTSLRARLGGGFLFSLVAAIFNSGSTFLVNIAVANLLGREIFGEFAMIQSTLLTFSNVAALATGFTATKYVAEFRLVDKAKTGRILGLCSILSLAMGGAATVVVLASAPWLAVTVLKAPYLCTGLMLAATVVFFNVNNFYQTGALAGLEAFSGIARAGVIAGTAYFILCYAGAHLWSREGAFAGLAISAGVQWLALRFHLRRECVRQGIVVDYHHLGEHRGIFTKFSVPAALSGFSTMPALWLANAFLVRQPDGYAQMALYAAATNLRVLVLFLPQLMNNVGVSLLNNAKGLGDTVRYRKLFWGNLWVTGGMTLAAAAAMTFFGPTLLAVFGRSFGEGYPVLLVLLASTLLESLTVAVYQIIQSQGRMWLSLSTVALPRDTLIVLLAAVLTPIYGALGLALAYTLGWGLALLSTTIVTGSLGRKALNSESNAVPTTVSSGG
jgi:O-antigen/teichoic acid export membrane protein